MEAKSIKKFVVSSLDRFWPVFFREIVYNRFCVRISDSMQCAAQTQHLLEAVWHQNYHGFSDYIRDERSAAIHPHPHPMNRSGVGKNVKLAETLLNFRSKESQSFDSDEVRFPRLLPVSKGMPPPFPYSFDDEEDNDGVVPPALPPKKTLRRQTLAAPDQRIVFRSEAEASLVRVQATNNPSDDQSSASASSVDSLMLRKGSSGFNVNHGRNVGGSFRVSVSEHMRSQHLHHEDDKVGLEMEDQDDDTSSSSSRPPQILDGSSSRYKNENKINKKLVSFQSKNITITLLIQPMMDRL